MTTFAFNTGVPASGNDPSVDQPDMLTNNVSDNAIWGVDHLAYGSAGSGGAGASAGQHLKVTYNSKTTPAPGTPVDPISISNTADATSAPAVPTATGSASAVAQEFFTNSNGKFPTSAIKAFGVFTATQIAGLVTPFMGMNVVSITSSGLGVTYTIALTPNAVVGTTALVFATTSNLNRGISWSLAANTLTLTVNVNSAISGDKISFAILQI